MPLAGPTCSELPNYQQFLQYTLNNFTRNKITNSRMTMPHGHCDNSTKEVQVPPTFVVEQPLHMTLMQHQRFLVNVVHSRWYVFGLYLVGVIERRPLKISHERRKKKNYVIKIVLEKIFFFHIL